MEVRIFTSSSGGGENPRARTPRATTLPRVGRRLDRIGAQPDTGGVAMILGNIDHGFPDRLAPAVGYSGRLVPWPMSRSPVSSPKRVGRYA